MTTSQTRLQKVLNFGDVEVAVAANSSFRIIRFGTFEVNFQTGELRKRGQRVKLQEQPFQMLAALLERPGEIVTREELRSKLWPADTFVDFDHSLNAAVKRLRDALGESADTPVFIETLARRGYRFIGSVDGAQAAVLPGGSGARQGSRAPRAHHPLITVLALVLFLGVILALVSYNRSSRKRPATARVRSIAVLPLDNLSHDPEQEYFADGMTEALINNLSKIGAPCV